MNSRRAFLQSSLGVVAGATALASADESVAQDNTAVATPKESFAGLKLRWGQAWFSVLRPIVHSKVVTVRW